ncbi:MAG: zf-HC2 domain-containing protein [Anaerolineales bacterium]
MNEHRKALELLAPYAAGSLPEAGSARVEAHLRGCSVCREELSAWNALAAGVREAREAAPGSPRLADRALRKIRATGKKPPAVLRAAQLLWAQIPIIRQDIWSVSALVTLVGFFVALTGERVGFLRELAPMVAAAGVAMLIGPQNDPAEELVRSASIPQRQILLARLALVFGYNLLLAGAASLGLFPILPEEVWGGLILGWLGPMAFLSSLALLFSLWIGTTGAVALVYTLWLSHWALPGMDRLWGWSGRFPAAGNALAAYAQFWNSPALLLAASAAFFAGVVWLAGRARPSSNLTPP